MEELPMGKHPVTFSARVLLLQMLSHALIFAAQNVGGFAERALLAADASAAAALGLSWTLFCLLYTYATSAVTGCQLVVGRHPGDADDRGVRAATGQALLLAGGGGAVGLAVAAAAGVAAAFAAGTSREAALFLATQGLALGPLLGAKVLTAHFTGGLRVGPRLLAAVSVVPIAVHLALVWLLTVPLPWSVAGVGLARLGAALAAAAATVAVARSEFGGLLGLVRRPNWAKLWSMFTEGSVLGLQQVLAGFIVLLLYLTASQAGEVASAALTLTHAGVYPLLFCFAWGGSQAVGAAAAQAVGRGDARALRRVAWLGLGLSAVLAFALPWGAFAAFGGPILASLVGGGSAGQAMLAASLQFMGLLAVFFVFDFAINYLSALLRAAKEEAYLLKATAAAAAGFGLLLFVLPQRPDAVRLMAAFIAAQAVWAVLLFVRVVGRWPVAATKPSLAGPGPQPSAATAPAAPSRAWVAPSHRSPAPRECANGHPALRRRTSAPVTARAPAAPRA
jgi:Na+-driven multidrug efflux pump